MNVTGSRFARRARRTERRPPPRDWAAVVLRPQVLVALVALMAAIPYLVGAFAQRPVEVALPPLADGGGPVVRAFDMPLVIVSPSGETRTTVVSVRAADHEAARLRATLAELRDALVAEGVWPIAVPAPTAIAFTASGRRVVVADVAAAGPVTTTVLQEWAAVRSLVETLRAVGADEVRIVVNGSPATTLWGHVALP